MGTKRRRCPSCRKQLPADASPRRVYCGGPCVAKAYRARLKRQRAEDVMTIVAKAMAMNFNPELRRALGPLGAAYVEQFLADLRCPVCGALTWASTRRRADAWYCSPKCRQRAYRLRRAGDHDGQP